MIVVILQRLTCSMPMPIRIWYLACARHLEAALTSVEIRRKDTALDEMGSCPKLNGRLPKTNLMMTIRWSNLIILTATNVPSGDRQERFGRRSPTIQMEML